MLLIIYIIFRTGSIFAVSLMRSGPVSFHKSEESIKLVQNKKGNHIRFIFDQF